MLTWGFAQKQAISWEGYAPVHAAAAYGRVSVMHMLLTFGADAKAATPEGVRDLPPSLIAQPALWPLFPSLWRICGVPAAPLEAENVRLCC